jgi:hypothetical protein
MRQHDFQNCLLKKDWCSGKKQSNADDLLAGKFAVDRTRPVPQGKEKK